ncbi:MAG: ACP S-malonyltransferase [Emergencia sp.]
MKLGIVFAGQGSQTPGMGRDFYEISEEFRRVFDLLPDAQKNAAFEGPAEILSDTRNTQPVMVAFAAGVSALLLPELEKLGIAPAMTAGLSLGEYSALEAAGVFDAETAVRLVTLRGKAMAEAAEGVDCAMKAVLNLDREILAQCCRQAASEGLVQIANYNCPGQIVIAGEREAVDAAAQLATEKGAKRCVPLAVSGPFHTDFMKPAAAVLHEAFEKTEFGEMAFPVIFNCTGKTLQPGETVASMLEKQVCSSVYFEDTIRLMAENGIDTIIEVGPGRALSGFVRKTEKNIKVLNIEKAEDLEKVLGELKGACTA